MKAMEVLDIVRGAVRPYLAIIFPTAVIIMGGVIAFRLLPKAVAFIDREIALIIIVTVLAIVAMIVNSAGMIMSFMFGERATKKKEDK